MPLAPFHWRVSIHVGQRSRAEMYAFERLLALARLLASQNNEAHWRGGKAAPCTEDMPGAGSLAVAAGSSLSNGHCAPGTQIVAPTQSFAGNNNFIVRVKL